MVGSNSNLGLGWSLNGASRGAEHTACYYERCVAIESLGFEWKNKRLEIAKVN
jgi:hypothetical protein